MVNDEVNRICSRRESEDEMQGRVTFLAGDDIGRYVLGAYSQHCHGNMWRKEWGDVQKMNLQVQIKVK
jgi:hypothetical protein